MVELSDKDIEAYAQTSNIIMLSPDASQTIEDINKDFVYIIGGLVDRTRKKAISLNRANEKQIPAMRLPIEEENITVLII